MTRAYNTATTQQNSGGAVSGVTAGKNAIINGSMDIWQRGTSSNGTAYNYTADRWINFREAFAAGATFSRSTDVPSGFTYSLRVQRDSGNTNSTWSNIIRQAAENTDSLRFAGQTVTLSFWAKAGANYSAASSVLISRVYMGEGTDQAANNMTGWTTVTNLGQNNTLTTSWQRFTQTISVAAAKKQIGVEFSFLPTGTAGADDSYYITGVQLELGSVATPFSRAGGTIQGELAACQRYYWRSSQNDVYSHHGLGIIKGGTSAMIDIKLPVTMRVRPTSIDFSTVGAYDSSTIFAATSIGFQNNQSSADTTCLDVVFSGGGGTQFRPAFLINNNSTSGYIGLNAEL